MHSNRYPAGGVSPLHANRVTRLADQERDTPIHQRPWAHRFGLGASICLILSGCAVGPDFKTPALPQGAASGYSAHGLTSATTAAGPDAARSGIAQHLTYSQDLSAQWWELFHSEPLNQLINRALQHNTTLAAAQASLRQARANLDSTSDSQDYPTFTGQLGATRERAVLTGSTPSDYTLYNSSVNVSYTLDLFGGERRQQEALRAAVDYQRYEVEAAYQTLVSNVVTTAIQQASLRAQLQATQALLEAQQRQLAVIEKQLALGAVAQPAVLAQGMLVAQTRAQLPALDKQLSQTQHQMAVYVGAFPGESGLPEFQLEDLQLPTQLPVSLPSALVRQRPDIRASEVLLHQASAQVGVATANLYPQITLSGSYGSDLLQLGGLSVNNTLWNLGAGLTQPLFDAGALRAKRSASTAAYDQAEAQYRETVLKAFQNVADALHAIDADASTLKYQAEDVAQARRSLEVSTRQYALGGISYLSLLDAERSYQQARVSLASAQAARLSDSAALFLALGGGWWNRPATHTQPVDSLAGGG